MEIPPTPPPLPKTLLYSAKVLKLVKTNIVGYIKPIGFDDAIKELMEFQRYVHHSILSLYLQYNNYDELCS